MICHKESQIFPILRRILSKINVEVLDLNVFVIKLYKLFRNEYLTDEILDKHLMAINSDHEIDELCDFCDKFTQEFLNNKIK